MKVVLFFFDYTGVMAKPWAEAGYECYIFDIQHPKPLMPNGKGERIHTVGGDIRNRTAMINSITRNDEVVGLFAFPPCTDLAVSGARHFENKKIIDPDYKKKAMSLVYLARDWGERLEIPYMIENPVSVISTEWRKPDHIFHPYEYGGYLPRGDRHPEYPKFIAPRDAYTKKTCLWTGNGFKMPKKKVVRLPDGYKYSLQHTQLGGKSLMTKNIRSATPRGFAKAVFLENKTPTKPNT